MKKTLVVLTLFAATLLAGCTEPAPAQEAVKTTEKAQQSQTQQQNAFIEGRHYAVVDPEGVSDGPLVTEFFSLYCGGCYNMESRFLPQIVPELAKQGITFEQKHVDFARNQTSEAVVRGFSVLQQITAGEQRKALKETLYEILGGKGHDHSDHSLDDPAVETLADLRAIFVAAGVDGTAFDAAAASEQTSAEVTRWAAEQQQFQVASVPSFVVNNRYLINLQSIDNLAQLIDLMAYLSAR